MTSPVIATVPGSSQSNEMNGSGGRLVTADGRTLPLRAATLRADAVAGVARVVLEQTFENPYDEPLHVTYLMPLPADGAVSGYAFVLGGRRVVGEVDKKKVARQRFERALAEGRSAGLVEEERTSLFTQELGNVPPRATVVAEITIDQRLVWLDEGAWEWRFPTVAGPRYTGAPGRVADAAKTEIAVADGPLPVRMALALKVRDGIPGGGKPESSSHRLHVAALGGSFDCGFADEAGSRLDRDVVVRWRAATPGVGLSIDTGRPARGATSDYAFGLVTLVPPAAGTMRARRRDLILLLDTSGSMGGEPLNQLKRVAGTLIGSLADGDRLEMIEFSTAARRWKRGATVADARGKADAMKWLGGLEAGGGTEMVAGVMEALKPLDAEAQRQVVLMTDGYIGFETEVVKAVRAQLPRGSRLHVVGVGSAVNRSLTGPTARAGRGLETIVAPGEDPEAPARRLMARTAQPVVTDVEIDGEALVSCAPGALPDLYAGSPALAAIKLRPEGGTLRVRGRTADGMWESRVTVRPTSPGDGNPAASTLYGREAVADLELARAAGGAPGELDGAIEKLGIDHQIATRLTSWIAVSQDITVDPTAPTRHSEVPQELPHGVSAEGLGLRQAGPVGAATATGAMPMMKSVMAPAPMQGIARPSPSMPAPGAPMSPPASMGGAPPPPPVGAPPPRPSPARSQAPEAKKDEGIVSKTISAIGEAAASLGRAFRREDTGVGAAPTGADADAPEPIAPAEQELDDVGESFGELADEEEIVDGTVERESRRSGAAAPTVRKKEKARDRSEANAAEKTEAAPVPPKKPAPRRRLRAVLKLVDGGRLILEIVVDGAGLEFAPPQKATVRLDDGRLVDATLDTGATTRAGTLAAGTRARIALSLGASPGAATPTLVILGDLELEVHAA